MILFTFYVAFGILNLVVSYDREILMIADKRWRWSLEALLEAVLYVFLWPVQLLWWLVMTTGNAVTWFLAKVMG